MTPTMTIQKGTSRSDALKLPFDLAGISSPDAWTSAPLTFRVSADGVTWNDAKNPDDSLVQMEVIPGVFLPIPPGACAAGSYIMLVSGTPDSPVSQEADRVFTPQSPSAAGPTEPEVEVEHHKKKEEKKDARGPDRHK